MLIAIRKSPCLASKRMGMNVLRESTSVGVYPIQDGKPVSSGYIVLLESSGVEYICLCPKDWSTVLYVMSDDLTHATDEILFEDYENQSYQINEFILKDDLEQLGSRDGKHRFIVHDIFEY